MNTGADMLNMLNVKDGNIPTICPFFIPSDAPSSPSPAPRKRYAKTMFVTQEICRADGRRPVIDASYGSLTNNTGTVVGIIMGIYIYSLFYIFVRCTYHTHDHATTNEI